jgi:hypothetical protein
VPEGVIKVENSYIFMYMHKLNVIIYAEWGKPMVIEPMVHWGKPFHMQYYEQCELGVGNDNVYVREIAAHHQRCLKRDTFESAPLI